MVALALCATALHADAAPARWTRHDTWRELGYDALLLVDARQTQWAVRHGYRERNPLLGSRPSQRAVNEHFLAMVALHGLVSAWMPPLYRRQWQWGSLAVEAFAVAHNAWIGVRLRF